MTSPCYYCEADDDEVCKTCIHSNTYENPKEIIESQAKRIIELESVLMDCISSLSGFRKQEDWFSSDEDTLERANKALWK